MCVSVLFILFVTKVNETNATLKKGLFNFYSLHSLSTNQSLCKYNRKSQLKWKMIFNLELVYFSTSLEQTKKHYECCSKCNVYLAKDKNDDGIYISTIKWSDHQMIGAVYKE